MVVIVGVQVDCKLMSAVLVAVGNVMVGIRVGGGNGLNPEVGLIKITRNTSPIHITVSKISTVNTFHTRPSESL
jgi:hypothetical protein